MDNTRLLVRMAEFIVFSCRRVTILLVMMISKTPPRKKSKYYYATSVDIGLVRCSESIRWVHHQRAHAYPSDNYVSRYKLNGMHEPIKAVVVKIFVPRKADTGPLSS
jgi:hypothetical protein